MLSLLFALLELDYGVLRARTPYFEVYTIKQKTPAGWAKVLGDTDVAAKAIRSNWTGSTSKQVSELPGIIGKCRSTWSTLPGYWDCRVNVSQLS